jgi:hypothetical protein
MNNTLQIEFEKGDRNLQVKPGGDFKKGLPVPKAPIFIHAEHHCRCTGKCEHCKCAGEQNR